MTKDEVRQTRLAPTALAVMVILQLSGDGCLQYILPPHMEVTPAYLIERTELRKLVAWGVHPA